MTRSITVLANKAYGHTRYYPQCEDAKRFAIIAGTTTLTTQALHAIITLGYDVNIDQPQYTLQPRRTVGR